MKSILTSFQGPGKLVCCLLFHVVLVIMETNHFFVSCSVDRSTSFKLNAARSSALLYFHVMKNDFNTSDFGKKNSKESGRRVEGH